MCYDELIDNNIEAIGESLYVEHFFFSNTYELLDAKYQKRIKEYNFCKAFNCPPFKSLDVTPADIVDDFLDIEYELTTISKIEAQKTKGKNK